MTKKRRISLPLTKLLYTPALAVLIMTVFLGLTNYVVQQVRKNEPVATGVLEVGGQVPAVPQDYYKSLDLSVAERANYPGGILKKAQNLGVNTDGVREYVVNFPVPEDNLSEYGLMTVPTTPEPPHGYPVILLCHGYYNPKDYSTADGYINDMDFYSQHGFIVIKPDFRGQGLSYGQGEADGAYYSMAYNTDLMSLITTVKHTSYLDKNQISLWGHSMGAYIALRAAVMSPDIKNLILLSGPVGTVQDMFTMYTASSDVDNPVAAKIRQAALLEYGTPLSNPDFWDATSPLTYLSQLKAHVQIYVGSDDRVVPPRFSDDLDNALTKAGVPHQYFVYQGGNHGLMEEKSQIYQSSLQLLQQKPASS